jgi:hypothetical protein
MDSFTPKGPFCGKQDDLAFRVMNICKLLKLEEMCLSGRTSEAHLTRELLSQTKTAAGRRASVPKTEVYGTPVFQKRVPET